MAHLAREDRELYPRLREAAAADRRLGVLLTVLAADLSEVSALAESFFGAIDGSSSTVQVAGEYGRLLAALGMRIRREETTLYPEFERVAGR